MLASSRNGELCRRFLHSRLRKVTGAQRAPLWSLWGKQRSFSMRCRAAFTQHFHRFGIGFRTCFRNLFLSLRMTCIAVMVATTPGSKKAKASSTRQAASLTAALGALLQRTEKTSPVITKTDFGKYVKSMKRGRAFCELCLFFIEKNCDYLVNI